MTDIKKELNEKNTLAIEQTLKETQLKVLEMIKKFEGLHNFVASLNNRVNQIEIFNITQKVKLVGNGRTV